MVKTRGNLYDEKKKRKKIAPHIYTQLHTIWMQKCVDPNRHVFFPYIFLYYYYHNITVFEYRFYFHINCFLWLLFIYFGKLLEYFLEYYSNVLRISICNIIVQYSLKYFSIIIWNITIISFKILSGILFGIL